MARPALPSNNHQGRARGPDPGAERTTKGERMGQEFWMQFWNSHLPTILAIGGVFVAIKVVNTVGSVLKSNARERSRREIAAYIAEGSMTPEHGERLLKAGDKPESTC